MYRGIQNRPHLFFSTRGFDLISLNILIHLLKLNYDFKYFIHVGRVLKRGLNGSLSSLKQKYPFILNLKLTDENIYFVPHSFIWNTV